jgi:hypothetical protein
MKNVSIYCLLLIVYLTTPANALQIFPSRSHDVGESTQLAGRSIRSGNAVIVVQVNDTLGSSLLNPFKGLFNIGTATNKPLLATFPQEQYFSHFNVRIDGTVYSNNPNRTGAQPLPLLSDPMLLADSTITCSYQVSGVKIEQRLTPEQYSSTTGAILIKYLITNADVLPHQIGLLLLLDTFVGGTDNARVATRFDYSRIERQYVAPLIPDYFQAFERDNPALPGLVGQGTLVGREAVRPDLVIVGDAFTLRAVQWNYTIQNPFYNDSAVILRWNETRLAPNESRVIATYYGLGDVNVQAGALALNLTAPNRLEAVAGQLTPNPFEVNLIVFNTGSVAATGVQATLNLPSGLALASGELATKPLSPADLNAAQIGTASWKILAQCPPADDSLSFRVDVKATNTNVPPNSLARKIFVPSCAAFKLSVSPLTQNIIAGQTANYSVNVQPSGGFAGSVRLALLPATPPPGITATFSPVSINANTTSTLAIQTDPALLPGNYSFAIVGASGGLSRNEIIFLNVQAAPPVDKAPPFVVNHSPAPRATGVSPNTAISFEVRDDLSGVDSASIAMRVNGNSMQPVLQRRQNGYLANFKPAAPFALNDTVRVSVEASDRAIPPNRMPTENFYFVTQRDVIPPFATNHRPAKGATNVPLDTDIRVEVVDALAGVDRSSLSMQVNGQLVQPNSLAPILQGFSVQYKPAQNFQYNSIIQVVIRGRDLARPVNEMPPDTLRFATIRDVEPPFTTDHQPAKGATAAPANTNIVLRVRDLVAGVDHASIAMAVNGAAVSPTITGSPQDYKLEYDPPRDFAPGDTVRVSLTAKDLSFPPNAMPLETYFFVIQELLPDLAVTSLRLSGVVFVGAQGEVIGEIANMGSVDAGRAFNAQFRIDGGVQKDTTFSGLAAGARTTLRLPLRFQTTGTHQVELRVDANDNIHEITKANNSQKVEVQVSQSAALVSRLLVRPNPFTPNNDGYNDEVKFDYAGLGLQNPSLQIFDANGIAVWSSNGPSAGQFTWNGRDDRGREVVPGVYLYSLRDRGNNVASGYVVVAR